MNTKSATTAGLLGIFLGAFGAHNWYLGEKNKGIIHVCLMGGGLIVQIVTSVVLPSVLPLNVLFTAGWLLAVFGSLASFAMGISGVWGFIEGIIILSQGDAGLAHRGYTVASPLPPQNNSLPPQDSPLPPQDSNELSSQNNTTPQEPVQSSSSNQQPQPAQETPAESANETLASSDSSTPAVSQPTNNTGEQNNG